MNTKIKYGLSAAVLALIAAGAPAPDILDQFLDEKEGNHTTAYRDGAGIWTICRGAIMVDGKPVVPGMKLSKAKCAQVNATGPQLADTVTRDYFTLRERLMTMHKQLEGAQDYIRTQCLK
ncbi:lysis system i-spanin subunit Rz [Escherichia coli]